MGINDPVETTEFPIDKFTYGNLTYLLEDHNFFIAFYGTTDYEEIGDAYTDNKLIFCYDSTSGIFSSLGTHTSNGPFTFYSINNTEIISMSVNNNDQWSQGGQTIPALPSYGTTQNGKFLTVNNGNLAWGTPTDNDTKNTAGASKNTSQSDLYLIGATSQSGTPQTYTRDGAYISTGGILYSGGTKVALEGGDVSIRGTTTNAITNAGGLSMTINNLDDPKKLNITFNPPTGATGLWNGISEAIISETT